MRLNSEYIVAPRPPEWRENGEDTLPLPTAHVVDHHVLTVNYDWGVTGGGAGAMHSDAYARILREFVLRGNDDDLQVYSGSALHLYNLFHRRELPEQTPPTSVAAGAAQANRQSVIILPTGAMSHARVGQGDFAFPPVRAPSGTFRWAAAQDLTTLATDGVAAITAVSTRFQERFHQAPTPPPGGYAPVRFAQVSLPVVAAGPMAIELAFLLSARDGGPGMEVRAVLIEALTDGVGGRRHAGSNLVVSEVTKIRIGGRTVQDRILFDDQRQINKEQYSLATRVTGAVLFDAADVDQNVMRGELWDVTGRGSNDVQLVVAPQGAGENRVRITVLFTAGRHEAVSARRRAA